ncbi:hypothetical protein N9917_01375 [Deltaproteobacteria bacterium]|nr:hypothetical protein [Deltaproteobacteria bacterium]
MSLTITGTFSPPGEPGPSNEAELAKVLNDLFLNQWPNCGNLRAEVEGQERPDEWACTGCDWRGPEPQRDREWNICPNCNDDVEPT